MPKGFLIWCCAHAPNTSCPVDEIKAHLETFNTNRVTSTFPCQKQTSSLSVGLELAGCCTEASIMCRETHVIKNSFLIPHRNSNGVGFKDSRIQTSWPLVSNKSATNLRIRIEIISSPLLFPF